MVNPGVRLAAQRMYIIQLYDHQGTLYQGQTQESMDSWVADLCLQLEATARGVDEQV